MEFSAVERVSEFAPDEVTVHNDGSLKVPQNQSWGLGGFGVWWDKRDTNTQPLTLNELDYAYYKFEAEGLELWGSMPGFMCSSTRTEI